MKIGNSNKSFSIIIAGIIVLTILSIFVAYASEVGGPDRHSSYGSEILGISTCSVLPEDNDNIETQEVRKSSPVPVAQECELGPFDTEAGEIEIIENNFPYIDENGNLLPLPICITNEMAQTWNWTVRVKGGYSPIDTLGYWPGYGITVWQDSDKDYELELVQGWNIDWTDLGKDPQCDCCSCRLWLAKPAYCGNKVCLDSNQYPEVIGCDCDRIVPHNQDEIPGKEVYVQINTLWEGCPLEDQQFAYILAQKKDEIPIIPNSRIKIFKITSLVECNKN